MFKDINANNFRMLSVVYTKVPYVINMTPILIMTDYFYTLL